MHLLNVFFVDTARFFEDCNVGEIAGLSTRIVDEYSYYNQLNHYNRNIAVFF